MIAPVYEPNKSGRYVYLPEDMLLWKVKKYTSKDFDVINKGHNYINLDLNEFAVFIRKNRMFVYGEPAQNTELLNNETLNVLAFVADRAEYDLYDDDGISKEYLLGEHSNLNITIILEEDKHTIVVKNSGNNKVKELLVTIITAEGKIITEKVNV